jgi:hypothetical protein
MPSLLATSLTVKLCGGNSFFNTVSFLSGEYRVTQSSLALCSINDDLMRVTTSLTQGAYRVCLGLLNLSKKYPVDRLNSACRIANTYDLVRLAQVRSILKSNRDQLPEQLSLTVELPQDHGNIRGPKNFQ